MTAPRRPPLGLQINRSSRDIGRAFGEALASAGGSHPMWMIMITLKSGNGRNQQELAESVGIRGATLSHHLNALESDGLVTRRRDPDNRRVHIVELTEDGEDRFHELRAAAAGFDRRLRRGISADDLTRFSATLQRLRDNVA